MSALPVLLTLSALLGLTSFGIGILSLSFTFSGEQSYEAPGQLRSCLTSIKGAHMSKLSSLGTGLLLGAALGVIIPEYVRELFCYCSHRPNTPVEQSCLS